MTEYLISFFETLGGLTKVGGGDISHAIDYEDGWLFVLVSMGDLRARLPLPEMDLDPAMAAQEVFDRWKSMSSCELEPSLEGRRG